MLILHFPHPRPHNPSSDIPSSSSSEPDSDDDTDSSLDLSLSNPSFPQAPPTSPNSSSSEDHHSPPPNSPERCHSDSEISRVSSDIGRHKTKKFRKVKNRGGPKCLDVYYIKEDPPVKQPNNPPTVFHRPQLPSRLAHSILNHQEIALVAHAIRANRLIPNERNIHTYALRMIPRYREILGLEPSQ